MTTRRIAVFLGVMMSCQTWLFGSPSTSIEAQVQRIGTQVADAVAFLRSRLTEADGALYSYSSTERLIPYRFPESSVLVVQHTRRKAFLLRTYRLCDECPRRFIADGDEFDLVDGGLRPLNVSGEESVKQSKAAKADCLLKGPLLPVHDFESVFEIDESRGLPCAPPPRDLTKPVAVRLSVFHNGLVRPGPAEVVVSFAGNSLRLPMTDGRFQAPPELFKQPSVLIEMDVDGSHIRIPEEHGSFFTAESWTLRIAERVNQNYYDWSGPRDARIQESCMLHFESEDMHPSRTRHLEHCRSPLKK